MHSVPGTNVQDGSFDSYCVEADTRVLIHLLHALQTSTLGMVHAGNTDVFVILLSNFHHIQALNTAAEIWISFKGEKQVCTVISLHYIDSSLGVTYSSFKFKAKWYCCKLIHGVSSLTEEFETVVNPPFQTVQRLKKWQQFVCRLYCYDSSGDNDVDLVRLKTRDV